MNKSAENSKKTSLTLNKGMRYQGKEARTSLSYKFCLTQGKKCK